MDYPKLKAELAAGHPGGVGGSPSPTPYDADSAVALAQIRAENRTTPKASLTGDELFTATDVTEFGVLSDAKQNIWVSWCSTSRDPWNAVNVAFVKHIFGDTSTTVDNLQAARVLSVGRDVELGLGVATEGDIQIARAN